MAPDGKSGNVNGNSEHGSVLKPKAEPAKTQNVKEEAQVDKKDSMKESQIRRKGKEKRITLTTGEAALGDVSTVEDEEDKHTESVNAEDEDGIDIRSPDLTTRGPVFNEDDDEVEHLGDDNGVAFPFAVRRPSDPQPVSRDYDSDGYEKNRPTAGKGFEEGEVPDEKLEMEHPFNKGFAVR